MTSTQATAPARTLRVLRARGPAGICAAIGALTLVLMSGCTETDTAVSDPTRVVQAVNVSVSPDGQIGAISGTAIAVDDAHGKTSSAEKTFDPSAVADDLPVRVTTRYRLPDSEGTDLSDLRGVSGRVEIDLELENLTVAPRTVSYDVAGHSRSEPALVGAPLTITASTTLAGTAPGSIVRDGGTHPGTNGVLSLNGDGDTVVQWATILAPPISGASTTLRLVANVSDFVPPTLDVAVQPGLATDLSSMGVLSGVLTPGPSPDLALQKRTIDLIGDVNEVLARAGKSITDVRDNLQTTATTLGRETATHLHESSSELAGSLTGLQHQLASLREDLNTSAGQTQDTALEQLHETVEALTTLLGDTAWTPPPPRLGATGCATTVGDPPEGTGSVYATLMTMAAQLSGYAEATARCQKEITSVMTRMIGPEHPTTATCASASMTCALRTADTAISGALNTLVKRGEDLIFSLEPGIMGNVNEQHGQLTKDLDALKKTIDAINPDPDNTAIDTALSNARSSVRDLRGAVTTVAERVAEVHGTAQRARDSLGSADRPRSIRGLTGSVADRICADLRTGIIPKDEALHLRAALSAEPCPADPATPNTPPPSAPAPSGGALDERLSDQAQSWDAVIAATSTATDTATIGAAISAVRTDLDTLSTRLDAIADAVDTGQSHGSQKLAAVRLASDAARAQDRVLGVTLRALTEQQSQVQTKIRAAFAKAAAESRTATEAIVEDQIREVSTSGAAGTAAITDELKKSVAGLTTTVNRVSAGARDTVAGQRARLEQASAHFAQTMNTATARLLTTIAESMDLPTRDVAGASTLLNADLARVMADLGDQRVGGPGLLGAMSTSSAKAGTADYQLALASEQAQGYANVREADIAGILRHRAEFTAATQTANDLPAFHISVPDGARYQSLYRFTIGASQ